MDFTLSRAQVRPGEAWAVAADRVAQAERTPTPVLAADLSKTEMRFSVRSEWRIAVRPMSAGDLRLVGQWIDEPHVARWWAHAGASAPEHFGPALAGTDPTRLWVWELNGRSVGFAQDYLIADHPDWALLCSRPDAVGFDYAIGEPAHIGKGLGTALLWVLLRDVVVPAYPGVGELFAAPDHRNLASRRVLAKLGAREGVWFDEPTATGEVSTVVGYSLNIDEVFGAS